MVATMESLGIRVRVPPPRGLLGRTGRDRHALPAAAAHGRPDDDLQVRGQEHRGGRWQDGDVHAEADLRGERVGHARAPVAVEGRRPADVRRRTGTRTSATWPSTTSPGCSTHAPALLGVLRADHELLSPARAGLRGAGQPRVLGAQPVGVRARADVPRGARRPSGSSSARRIRPRTPTSHSAR